jgi:hypothetical protein
MAVSFIGFGTGQASAAGLTVPMPGGVAQGDLIVLFVETAEQSVATPSGGWTPIQVFGSALGASHASASRLQTFWKRAGVGEGSVTVADGGDRNMGQVMVFRGVVASPTNPIANIKTGSAVNLDANGDALIGTWSGLTAGSGIAIGFGTANDAAAPVYTISGFASNSVANTIEFAGTDDGSLKLAEALNTGTSNANNPSIRCRAIIINTPGPMIAFEVLPAPDPVGCVVTAQMGSFGASAVANQRITSTTTAAMGSFSASAVANNVLGASATADLGAFEASAVAEPIIAADVLAEIGAFGATAEADPALGQALITADVLAELGAFSAEGVIDLPIAVEVVADLGAFGATAEVELLVIEAEATADMGAFGFDAWVFVGILEVPGDDDYNITVPGLDRTATIAALDRTATVPGLDRTLQVP